MIKASIAAKMTKPIGSIVVEHGQDLIPGSLNLMLMQLSILMSSGAVALVEKRAFVWSCPEL
jgi:hypothetical protein